MRGPLVYCLEEHDNPIGLNRVRLPGEAKFECRFEPDLLGGVVSLSANAEVDGVADWSKALYRTEPVRTESAAVKGIPYFAWDNRDPGEMLVWLRGE